MPGPYWPRNNTPTPIANLCHTRSVTKAPAKRAHVILPEDVVAGIDSLFGKRGRSAFLAEVAREEIQRRRQRLRDQRHGSVRRDAASPSRPSRSRLAYIQVDDVVLLA